MSRAKNRDLSDATLQFDPALSVQHAREVGKKNRAPAGRDVGLIVKVRSGEAAQHVPAIAELAGPYVRHAKRLKRD